MRMLYTLYGFFLLLVTLVMAGCGGGGSSINNSSGTQTIVYGTVSKGIFTSGLVSAYSIKNGVEGQLVGQTIINPDGTFTMPINAAGTLLLKAWGTYVDEADPTAAKSIPMTKALHAISLSPSSGVAITPLTELAYRTAVSLSDTEITKAQGQIEAMFHVRNILTTMPFRYGDSTAYSAGTDEQRKYTMVLAALSYMDKNNLQKDAIGIIDDITADIADGQMSSSMAATIQSAIIAMAGDTINELPELLTIGIQTVGITFSIDNASSSTPHAGLQVTLKLPDTVYIKTNTDNTVASDAIRVETGVNNLSEQNIAYNPSDRTITMILLFDPPFIAGDMITLQVSIPADSAPPTAFSYNGLTILNNLNTLELDTAARLSAHIDSTGQPVTLTKDITILLPGE